MRLPYVDAQPMATHSQSNPFGDVSKYFYQRFQRSYLGTLPRYLPQGFLNQFTLKVPSMFIAAIRTLCLNDHVVHDYTTGHHLMHGLKRPYFSWVTNNSSPSLEHTKCTVEIFPTSLLHLGKSLIYFLFGDYELSSLVWPGQDKFHHQDNMVYQYALQLMS
jgi:hypothetical protein